MRNLKRPKKLLLKKNQLQLLKKKRKMKKTNQLPKQINQTNLKMMIKSQMTMKINLKAMRMKRRTQNLKNRRTQ